MAIGDSDFNLHVKNIEDDDKVRLNQTVNDTADFALFSMLCGPEHAGQKHATHASSIH